MTTADGDPPRKLRQLLEAVRACTICAPALPHGVRPVVQLSAQSRVLIAGQAPGRRVHESGVPFDDPSGDRLRDWLGVDRDTFYDPAAFAILPMGFCYPGTGKSGDLPPRPECAPAWREELLGHLTSLRTTLIVGRWAMEYHLGRGQTLTEAVQAWRSGWPDRLPLPHPSPRNRAWFKRNPWFEQDVVPALRSRVADVLGSKGAVP